MPPLTSSTENARFGHRVFCCFWFQKSCSGNILGIGHREDRSPYFSNTYPESGGESKMGSRGATPCLGAAPPWPRLGRVWGPWPPTDVALPPIYSVPRENPKYPSLHPRKVPQPPSSSTLVWEGSANTAGCCHLLTILTKTKVPIFPTRIRSPKETRRGPRGWPHHS